MTPGEIQQASDAALFSGESKRFYEIVASIVAWADCMDPVWVPESVLEALQELREMSKS